MASFHNQVSLDGFHQENFMLTMKVSGASSVTDSRLMVGKAVSLDTTAANTVKLAADGDIIIGRLESFENRAVEGVVVGAVAFRFAGRFPIKAGETVVVGNTVIGAGAGEVKAAAALAGNLAYNFVAEVIGTEAVVVKF